MESFIYASLNQACRLKDSSKIQFYGAFAAALSYIIYYANKNKKNTSIKDEITVFRGLKMQAEEIETFEVNSVINLVGYTSTSKLFREAIIFAT